MIPLVDWVDRVVLWTKTGREDAGQRARYELIVYFIHRLEEYQVIFGDDGI